MSKKWKPETRAIRDTFKKDANAGAVSAPITLSTNFEREADGSYKHGFVYSRIDNPNRQLLEQSLATLESGAAAVAFSSGMAATSAAFQLLELGDHVILPVDAYYSTQELMTGLFEKWGVKMTTVDMSDPANVRNAVTESTKLIWVETPSNPGLKVSDIGVISSIAHDIGAICVIDNTWATPVIQNPLKFGADIVMHSSTKYLGGHGDVSGGALILKDNSFEEKLKKIQQLSGAVPSPFDCWLITRGIKTLFARYKVQQNSAHELANFLSNHPQIDKVHYPGLMSHPQYEIAQKQMVGGFGAMLSVEVKGDAKKAMMLADSLKLFTTATSLGGVESLIEHRKSVEGENSPTPDNLLRVSVGLENVKDLIDDWEEALNKI